MISEPSEVLTQSAATDRELAEVLDRYLRSLEDNAPLDVERLVADYPRLATDIRSFVASVDILHGATQGIGAAARATSSEDMKTTGSRPPFGEKRLGDFEIGTEIGRGGMGIVYEARQISLQRKVALKVLPFAAMWDHKQIARFQNEAQAAAQLHHPHIVPVFAVGQERGVHFYAMQLIQGRSLEQIVSQLRREAANKPTAAEPAGISTIPAETTRQSELSSEHAAGQSRYCRAIAGLGIQAANALHYAHECGVVHRDIKPSNLLVDHRNKLWITDFGLARVQDSPGVTVTGDVVGTLRYMSPEQATGRHALVDPRTDIYSLGATLYELLTLRPAFPGEDRQLVLKTIAECEPLSPRDLDPTIPIDLETIILQAMAKSREERYSSAAELAQDLTRFLEGRPTLARRPTITDRVGKWVRRHRVVVSIAAMFLFVLATVSTGAALLLSREHSRKLAALAVAQENLQHARQVVDRFGTQFAHELAKLPGSEPLRMAVLGDTLAYYQDFIERAAGDPTLKRDLATTHFHAGTIAGQLGQTEVAEQSFRTAAMLFGELAKESDDPAELRERQAAAQNNLALLFAAQGKLPDADQEYETAIQLQSTIVRDKSVKDASVRLLAEMFTNRGLLERQSGESAKARSSLSQAIKLLEQLVANGSHDREARHALAMAYNNRSFVEQESDWQAAEKSCRAAVDLFSKLIEETADVPAAAMDTRGDLALSYNNLAAILGHQSKDEAAVAAFRQAIEVQEQLVRQVPGVVQFRSDLAITWNNLAQAYAREEKSEEADAAYDRAEELFSKLVDDFPQDIRYQSSLAGVLNNRGMACELAGDLEAALSAYRKTIKHQKIAVEQSPRQAQYREFLSKHYFNCGRTLRMMNRLDEAAALALERRGLWTANGEQLFQVALELATIADAMEDAPDSQRDQVIGEAVKTLQQARSVGYEFASHEIPVILRAGFEMANKVAAEVQL